MSPPLRARDNPFAVQRVLEIRYRLPPDLTWEGLLDRLAALRWRAAIVGLHGRGKTTLLEDLAPHLAALGFRVRTIMLQESHPRLTLQERSLLRGLGPRDVLFLDGAEQLGRLAWLLVKLRSRRAGGIVVTSHQPGLLPTLLECETTPELLAGMLSELGEEGAPVEDLYARHGGNLREALRELYDRWAER